MIGEWVLILTMVTNVGVSLEHISGFSSKATCEVAGKEWIRTTYPKMEKYIWRYVPSYMCVKQ